MIALLPSTCARWQAVSAGRETSVMAASAQWLHIHAQPAALSTCTLAWCANQLGAVEVLLNLPVETHTYSCMC